MDTELESLREVYKKATEIADAAHVADRTAWMAYEAARNVDRVISELPRELTPKDIADMKENSAAALQRAQAAYEIADAASKRAEAAVEAARQAIAQLTGHKTEDLSF